MYCTCHISIKFNRRQASVFDKKKKKYIKITHSTVHPVKNNELTYIKKQSN